MKKLSQLIFVTCVVGVAYTMSQCSRGNVTPQQNTINNDTLKNTAKDTSGQDLDITCQVNITQGAPVVKNCVVYLVHTFNDYNNLVQSPHVLPAKGHYRMAVIVPSSVGQCTFDTVRPVTGTSIPGGASGANVYNYNIVAWEIDPTTGDTDKTPEDRGQTYIGTTLGENITVAENDQPKGVHKKVTVSFPQ